MELTNAKPANIAWHAMEQETVMAQLQSSPLGLSPDEAGHRLLVDGPNSLPKPQAPSPIKRFLVQFNNILIYVLLCAAAVTAALQHLADTLVIVTVIIANTLIGFIQEGKAERAIEAIHNMLAPMATVMRDGQLFSIPAEQLVTGDIVLLEAGDKVPADLRLLQSHGLLLQEAILTGESVPVEKYTEAVSIESAIADRRCLAFSGTLVASGQGKGIVVATGIRSEIGRISSLLRDVEHLTTPLLLQINAFSRWLTLFIMLLSGLLLGFGFFMQQQAFADTFMAVVGLAVAAIPEGLPAALTITMAIGVQAMAQRNAIVRRLPAIETLGSVSVICTDKTGTLTRNEMMVATVITMNHTHFVSGNGYTPEGHIHTDQPNAGMDISTRHTDLIDIARAAILCNDAALRENHGIWGVTGDPMEGALLSFARKAGLDDQAERRQWMRTDFIPFDARHRFMATLNHNHQGQALIFVKGAPEQVLEMCQWQHSGHGTNVPLEKNWWLQHVDSIAGQGQRLLALACKPFPAENTVLDFSDVKNGLVLLGMVGLIDPPRPESIQAVAECQRAGIRVKMITGDHAGTARAIARQIGISNCETVLTGAHIDRLDDQALSGIIADTDIFARTSPEHKLRLVMALQGNHHIVAMTGDGVNDAPALKRADIGIAMGRKGSEAAREASDIVLADDNFASIVAAVREGRTVYNNIQKLISWILPTNAGEALTIIVAMLAGMTMPLTAIQILWINLVTDATLGIALAFDPSDAKTMQRPPRKHNEPLLRRSLVWRVALASLLFACGVFGIYTYAIESGYSIDRARTMAVNTIVAMEIFYLFFIRRLFSHESAWKVLRGTRTLWLTIAIITAGQCLITFLPALQQIFATEAISMTDMLLILAIGLLLLILLEAERLFRHIITRPRITRRTHA